MMREKKKKRKQKKKWKEEDIAYGDALNTPPRKSRVVNQQFPA